MKNALKLILILMILAVFVFSAFSCSSAGLTIHSTSAKDTAVVTLASADEEEKSPGKTAESAEAVSTDSGSDNGQESLSEAELGKEKEALDKKLMEEASANTAADSMPVSKMSADPVMPDGSYELIIITPLEFFEALVPLKKHKNQTGMKAKIISLEDIYTDFEGRDEAEKVKYCLAAYSKESKTRFAMLVGDSDKFPVRYTRADVDSPEIKNYGFFACDIYYANLFKSDGSFDDWDINKNGYYGELQGSVYTGSINVDKVDLVPEMCVGRIPASTISEVENYVAKDINYELEAAAANWINNILLIATTDFISTAPLLMEDIKKNFLTDKKIYKLYGAATEAASEEEAEKMKADGAFIEVTEPINPENVCKYINFGVGFISHLGHGTSDSWYNTLSVGDLNSLNNPDMLPIVFTGGCSTANFETHPPCEPYFDLSGVWHQGQAAGEVFNDIPPQPACIQPENNHDGMGEVFTVYTKNGFVGYVGCDTGAQPYAFSLNYLFLKALSKDKETLGEMWNYAIKEYYIQTKVPTTTTSPDWTAVAQFHQPWKFFLFGDPSLRINGVS